MTESLSVSELKYYVPFNSPLVMNEPAPSIHIHLKFDDLRGNPEGRWVKMCNEVWLLVGSGIEWFL